MENDYVKMATKKAEELLDLLIKIRSFNVDGDIENTPLSLATETEKETLIDTLLAIQDEFLHEEYWLLVCKAENRWKKAKK